MSKSDLLVRFYWLPFLLSAMALVFAMITTCLLCCVICNAGFRKWLRRRLLLRTPGVNGETLLLANSEDEHRARNRRAYASTARVWWNPFTWWSTGDLHDVAFQPLRENRGDQEDEEEEQEHVLFMERSPQKSGRAN